MLALSRIAAVSLVLSGLKITPEPKPEPKPATQAKPAPSKEQVLKEAEEEARRQVREGFDTEEEIVTSVVDVMSVDHPDADLRAPVAGVVHTLLEEQRRAESTWKTLTHCDRLDRAFAALERRGVVARQDFSDCQTCGHSEMGEELAKNRTAHGYVFFHDQDTERSADGEGLMLAYGARSQREQDVLGVAREIVAELKKAGLRPEWNGSVERRIGVPMTWQKRRFTQAPAAR